MALDRLDAWRIGHPGTALRQAAYVHPFRINIGFVATADATEVLAATNRVHQTAMEPLASRRQWAQSCASSTARLQGI